MDYRKVAQEIYEKVGRRENLVSAAHCATRLRLLVDNAKCDAKAVALPSAFSCFMGITEPAIFGVNLRHFKPFVCGAVGGAVGAMYASLVHLGASGTGVTGLFGLLLCLQHPLEYIIMAAISIGVAFVLTWLFGYKDPEPETSAKTAAPKTAEAKPGQVSALQCQPGTVYAPVGGSVVPSEQLPDETFATGVLGRGVGIEPEGDSIVAPFDGVISSVTDTCHAVGISSPDGMDLLIHVGVDTVDMKGDGFQCFVQEGQKVRAGEKLLCFDKQKISAAGHPDIVAVLVTNADEYGTMKIETDHCQPLQAILHLNPVAAAGKQ